MSEMCNSWALAFGQNLSRFRHAVHRRRHAAAGPVDEGNTVTDYDEEEISRAMSICGRHRVVEWGKTKINLIDTPGFNMFIHEAEMVLPAVEAALVVVDAVSGVEVVTERIWNYCRQIRLPRAIVCTRMDRDRADSNRVMESLTNSLRPHRGSRAVADRLRRRTSPALSTW